MEPSRFKESSFSSRVLKPAARLAVFREAVPWEVALEESSTGESNATTNRVRISVVVRPAP
jgi:hypothetical protein